MSQKFKTTLYGVAIGITVLHLIYIIAVIWVTPDVSIFLYIGDLLLDGARPYIDYVEMNPPLINYLHVIPVALSRLTGLHIATAFNLCVSLLTIGSAYLTYFLLKKTVGEQQPLLTLTIPIYILFHPFIRVDTINDFGQREYLFIIAYFPFFLVRWLRWQGYTFDPKLTFLIGFVASIGACIKPYYLLIGFVPELYFLLTHRDIKKLVAPEAIGFILFGILYGASFLLMPDSTHVLLNEILPSLLYGYRSSDAPLTPIEYVWINLPYLILLAIVGFIGLQFWKRTNRTISHFIFAGIIASVMGLAVVIMQGKGYTYHYNHFYFITHVLIITGLSLFPQVTTQVNRFKIQRILLTTTYGVTFTIAIILIAIMTIMSRSVVDSSYLKEVTNEGDYVLVIAGRVSIGFPEVLILNRRYANTYIGALPIVYDLAQFETRAEVYADGSPFINDAIRKYLTSLAQDISTKQPSFIIIDDECPCPEDFSMHEYLTRVGFVDETLLPEYEMLEPFPWGYGYVRITTP